MKVSKRTLGVVVATLAAAVALLLIIGAASADTCPGGQCPGKPVAGDAAKARPDPKPSRGSQWSALDKLDAFKHTLGDAGFGLEQGEVFYMDWVKMCCEGQLPHTGANNPAPNAYIALQFGGQPLLWQLGENEAIVMVGQTPPPAAYFSYNTILGYLPLEPGAPANESRPIVGITVGDAINNATIKTIGPDPFNRPIVYIITGHRGTERLVRAAARKAGYPDAIINVETISPVLGPLGRGDKGSVWFLAQRVAVPEDTEELRAFLLQVGTLNKVFRVTPNDPLAEQLGDDPEPVPVLRVRGTGHTEMALYPALKKLRAKILEKYGPLVSDQFKELDTKIWELEAQDTPIDRAIRGEKPYVGLQRGVAVLGASRDTNYLGSFPNFKLRDDKNEFVIVYGVNHQKTGKATYSSFAIYADKLRWFGLDNGTTLNRDFGDSAKQYLCPNEAECDPDWQHFYVWKVARQCNGEPYCMEVRVNDDPAQPFSDLYGTPYPCSLYDWHSEPPVPVGPFDLNEAEMFFFWRAYLEPGTKVGPDDNELLYDRAVYFGPYFTEH
jgi:hypothetical protein